jgi:hypothetical protein
LAALAWLLFPVNKPIQTAKRHISHNFLILPLPFIKHDISTTKLLILRAGDKLLQKPKISLAIFIFSAGSTPEFHPS